ncbi:MAG: DUF2201 family putative metallopeptidase [Gammaproteobacteria bacterium]
MANSSSPEEAAKNLQRARIRLALSKPFLASALLRLPLVAVPDSPWCETAATDGYHLFYNPAWTGRLDTFSLRGLLAHEVLHAVFGHAERRQERDPRRWNIACDHVINLLLIDQGFRLPDPGLADAAFRGMNAEQVYDRLPTHKRSASRQRLVSFDEEIGLVPMAGQDLVDPDHPGVRPLRTGDAPDRERLREIRAELVADGGAKLAGEGAGQWQVEIGALTRSRNDWRALLRAWLTDRLKSDWSMVPFSKKHLHRGLYLPSLGVEAPGDVVFALDTSGSMKEETLACLIGELRSFREAFPCRITLLQADTVVREERRFEAMDGLDVPPRLPIKGRGGTDFRPVFDWVRANVPEAVVLYATDGVGAFPAKPPHNPVLWLLTRGHLSPERIPFGAVTAIEG